MFDTAKLRKLLTEGFTSQELHAFCFDYFRPVSHAITPAMDKNQVIQHLLEHCHHHQEYPRLIRQCNLSYPQQFAGVVYDFELTITSTDTDYTIQAKAEFCERTPLQSMSVPFGADTLHPTLLDGRADRHAARAFGRALFDLLFTGEVLVDFRNTLEALPDVPDRRVCLRLHVPAALDYLPWELLYDPGQEKFLALVENISLVRSLVQTSAPGPLRTVEPFNVMIVLARPTDRQAVNINLDQELHHIEVALSQLSAQGQVAFNVVRGPDTLGKLRVQMLKSVHMVHIICAVDQDEENGEDVLLFEDAEGHSEPVTVDQVRLSLQQYHREVRLILLHLGLPEAHSSARVANRMSATLLQGDIPAIIALTCAPGQAPGLHGPSSIFYPRVVTRTPIDQVVSEVRRLIATQKPDDTTWMRPLLFMSIQDGLLFVSGPKEEPGSDFYESELDDESKDIDPAFRWLRWQGFNANPFDTTRAEEERERLPSFFGRVPFFSKLVGNPQQPQNLIVFAPKGCGKTAHRLEVARRVRERTPLPALPVSFTDFDLLWRELRSKKGDLSLDTYRPILIRKTIEALIHELQRQDEPWRLEKLRQHEDASARFCALQSIYAAPCHILPPPDATQRWSKFYKQNCLGFREWLGTLADIVRQAGFISIYFLVDGIDELTATNNSPETALQLIRPLLDSPGALESTGFAFKFFLPDTLEQVLQRETRLDSILFYSIRWDATRLHTMLRERLTSYSRASETDSSGRVNTFFVLCEGEMDVDDLLVKAAKGSPRQLINLARSIVEKHCYNYNAHGNSLISRETVQEVLGPWIHAVPDC